MFETHARIKSIQLAQIERDLIGTEFFLVKQKKADQQVIIIIIVEGYTPLGL